MTSNNEHSIIRPETKARLLAFYLPQFHPIPENNSFWGNGFTEWTNVGQARSLYPGQYQPRIPADLGFYDLRNPETRFEQAALASQYGIEGFCYWHYWFNGKRVLEKPFQAVLESGEPDFPFCLAWANDSWTGVWHGAVNKILIEQTYSGVEDYKRHFYAIAEAFSDKRYIEINGKKLFIVFRPEQIPNLNEFFDTWRECSSKEGLGEIHFLGIKLTDVNPVELGFDSYIEHMPDYYKLLPFASVPNIQNPLRTAAKKLKSTLGIDLRTSKLNVLPKIMRYSKFVGQQKQLPPLEKNQFPCVVPNWDNTPRCGRSGFVLHNSTPEKFKEHLIDALSRVESRSKEQKIVFIKSWNEWAEGNYLEPDLRYGHGYLEAVKSLICQN